VFFIILRGKNLRVCVIAFAAVLAHIAFDVFLSDIAFNTNTTFPLFSPFILDGIEFAGFDWLWIEIIGISIVAVTSYLIKRKEIKLKNNLTKT
jgi:membrane-associated PAP2 superfamily phosphatase